MAPRKTSYDDADTVRLLPERMVDDMQDTFDLTIEYDAKQENPERLFRGIAKVLEAFQEIDDAMVKCIDSDIESRIMLDDLERGSIVLKLRNIIEALPDDALRSGDYKKVVGEFLCRAKYKILEFLDDKETIDNPDDVAQLEASLSNLAQSTNASAMGCYTCPVRYSLLTSMGNLSAALDEFSDTDQLTMSLGQGQCVELNKSFSLNKDDILELCKGDVLENDVEMILQIRRPDFLGNMQWEFRHGDDKILAKLGDKEWMKSFRNHEFNVAPGDSLKVRMHSVLTYDKNNEPLSIKNTITKVLSIVPAASVQQQKLL